MNTCNNEIYFRNTSNSSAGLLVLLSPLTEHMQDKLWCGLTQDRQGLNTIVTEHRFELQTAIHGHLEEHLI